MYIYDFMMTESSHFVIIMDSKYSNWVSILWHAACAPSDAKLLEGGVRSFLKANI